MKTDYRTELKMDDDKFLLKETLKSVAIDDKPLSPYIKFIQILSNGINVVVYEERHDPQFPDWPVGRKMFTWKELSQIG